MILHLVRRLLETGDGVGYGQFVGPFGVPGHFTYTAFADVCWISESIGEYLKSMRVLVEMF